MPSQHSTRVFDNKQHALENRSEYRKHRRALSLLFLCTWTKDQSTIYELPASLSHLYFLSRMQIYKNTSFLTQIGSFKIFPCFTRYKGYPHHKTKKKKKISISHYSTFPPKSGLQRGFHSNSCACLQTQNNSHFPKEINQNTEFFFFSIKHYYLREQWQCASTSGSASQNYSTVTHTSVCLSGFFHFWKQILLHSCSFITTTNCILLKYHSSCCSWC